MKRADLKIENAHIVSMDGNYSQFVRGTVLVNNGQFIYVGDCDSAPEIEVNQTINVNGKILMPPFFNAHNHAPMSLFRGLGNDVPLKTWLADFIWPAESKHVNQEFVHLATLLAGIEMIRSGTSIFADMYFFEREVARAALELGMRCIVGEAVIDFPTPNKPNPEETLSYLEELLSEFQSEEKISFSVAAHAPYTCSAENLKKVARFSQKHQIPATIHLAETIHEVNDFRQKHKISPTRYLADLGFFEHHAVCYHCNYLSDQDMDLFRTNHVSAVSLPNSNCKLASGIAPIKELIDKDVNVALGTDGAASNNNMSMLSDLQLLLKLQKVKHIDPLVLSAPEALRIATLNGARAYRMDGQLGSVSVGKSADFIIVDTDVAHMQPLYDPYAQIAYSMQNSDVQSMCIAGEFVMENREIQFIDEQAVLREAKKLKRSLDIN